MALSSALPFKKLSSVDTEEVDLQESSEDWLEFDLCNSTLWAVMPLTTSASSIPSRSIVLEKDLPKEDFSTFFSSLEGECCAFL